MPEENKEVRKSFTPPFNRVSMEDDRHQKTKFDPYKSETIYDSEAKEENGGEGAKKSINVKLPFNSTAPTIKRKDPQIAKADIKIASPDIDFDSVDRNEKQQQQVDPRDSKDYQAFLKWKATMDDKLEMNPIDKNYADEEPVIDKITSSSTEEEVAAVFNMETGETNITAEEENFIDPNLSEYEEEAVDIKPEASEEVASINDAPNIANDKKLLESLNSFDEGLRLKFDESKYTDLDEYKAQKAERKEIESISVGPTESAQSVFDELIKDTQEEKAIREEIVGHKKEEEYVTPSNPLNEILAEKEESDTTEEKSGEIEISETIIERELDLSDESDEINIDAAEVDLSKFIKDKRFALNSDELSGIRIKKSGRFGDYKAIRNALPKRPSSTIILPQSGYWCEVSAITNRELQIIQDSTNTFYEGIEKVYRILHGKIEKMPGGKLAYDKWLKITSFFDYSTFLYGIYCQTFPFKNKYELTCTNPACRHRFEAEIPHASLIDIPGDKEAYTERINAIIGSVKQISDIQQFSLLTKTKRIQLPESSIVVDFRLPSLHQYLNESAKLISDENMNKKYSIDALMSLCFIEGMYMPDPYEYENSGNIEFIPVVEKTDQLFEINKFSVFDGTTFANELIAFTDNYRSTYSIKNVRCPKCKTELNSGELEILNLIFLALASIEQTLRKKRG